VGSLLQEWTDPPPMCASTPAPAVLATDGTLWLAYRIGRDQHHCAVVRFHRVLEYAWGSAPAALGIEAAGDLPRGSFYEVPSGEAVASVDERRWIITFPDALLDVRAMDVAVVLRATASLDPAHALAALLA
jgi:hypothetical protein